MAKYHDTGRRSASTYMATWFRANVRPTMKAFYGQFGYFDYDALRPFAGYIHAAGTAGVPVHLVLGANQKALSPEDVGRVYTLIEGLPDASLTVVAFSNCLFHPKVAVVERSDGSITTVVGSANLTSAGMGKNVEALIELDTREGDQKKLLREVIDAIIYWRSATKLQGAFRISGVKDIERLTSDRVLSTETAREAKEKAADDDARKRGGVGRTLPYRRAEWTSPKSKKTGARQKAGVTPPVPVRTKPPPSPVPAEIVLQWYKKLPASDAQQVGGGTNPTGKLRLTQSNQDIKHTTWFRNVFFQDADWQQEHRGSRTYDVAEVEFDVTVLGASQGKKKLKIDHAPHRIANQGNVPTVLAWGHDLMKLLRAKSHKGKYVTLVRLSDGTYRLEIADQR